MHNLVLTGNLRTVYLVIFCITNTLHLSFCSGDFASIFFLSQLHKLYFMLKGNYCHAEH